MRIFGLAGWSGSGKTTLVIKLLPELIGRGLTVSTIKHTHHNFDIDKPGKDSHSHRTAGANEVMLSSGNRWALMHQLNDRPEPAVAELAARMTPVDLLLVEGFKNHDHEKLEVYRPEVGKPTLHPENKTIVAIASDADLPHASVPVFSIDDIPAIADFIISFVGLNQESDRDLMRVGGANGAA